MENFDDIRPYRNEEFHQVFSQLAQEKEFLSILKYFFHEHYADHINKLYNVNTIDEFQLVFIKPILQGIIAASIKNLTYTGTKNIPTEQPCLFISNHRDIVMDPSLIDLGLHLNNVPTVEIAIGSNLLIKPWIEKLVKINKSFVVRRGLSGRDLLLSSMHLSSYIHHSITERNSYLWIAQREGRAKDGNDRTQESLLRMLGMSGNSKDLRKSLQQLNIVPICISYEYDPCDGLKAKELYKKSTKQTYVKTPQDDLENMELGIRGNKGDVNFHFASSINDKLNLCSENDPRKQAEAIANIIDRAIFSSYKLFDTHKVAYNMINETEAFDIPAQKTTEIKNYFLKQLSNVGLSENELPYILVQYANPVVNHLEITTK